MINLLGLYETNKTILVMANECWLECNQYFKDVSQTRDWFKIPHIALGFIEPVEVILAGRGRLVLEAISKLKPYEHERTFWEGANYD